MTERPIPKQWYAGRSGSPRRVVYVGGLLRRVVYAFSPPPTKGKECSIWDWWSWKPEPINNAAERRPPYGRTVRVWILGVEYRGKLVEHSDGDYWVFDGDGPPVEPDAQLPEPALWAEVPE